MTSFRIAFASALAVGAVLASGGQVTHGTPVAVRHATVTAAADAGQSSSPVLCCEDD